MRRRSLLAVLLVLASAPAAHAEWDAALVESRTGPAAAGGRPLVEGAALPPGTRFECGELGGVALLLPDGAKARLGARAGGEIGRDPDGAVRLKVSAGPAWLVAPDAARTRFRLGAWTLTGMDAEACVEGDGARGWLVAVPSGSWQLELDRGRKARLEAGRLYAWPAGEAQITILTRRAIAERQAWFTW